VKEVLQNCFLNLEVMSGILMLVDFAPQGFKLKCCGSPWLKTRLFFQTHSSLAHCVCTCANSNVITYAKKYSDCNDNLCCVEKSSSSALYICLRQHMFVQ